MARAGMMTKMDFQVNESRQDDEMNLRVDSDDEVMHI